MMRARSHLGPTDRKKLIAGIHAQAHALGLDDETRRAMQRSLVGVESAKDMSLGQLSTVWTRLTALAKEAGLRTQHSALSTTKRPGRDERLPDEPPTTEQLAKIERLYDALTVRESAMMMSLARRITGHPWAQTRAEANQLIEGLKKMAARGWRPRDSQRGGYAGAQQE
jgi:Protein of unknown function (DUF1018)